MKSPRVMIWVCGLESVLWGLGLDVRTWFGVWGLWLDVYGGADHGIMSVDLGILCDFGDLSNLDG